VLSTQQTRSGVNVGSAGALLKKAAFLSLLGAVDGSVASRASSTGERQLRARELSEVCLGSLPEKSGFENFLDTLNIHQRDRMNFKVLTYNNETQASDTIEGSVKINTNECRNGVGKQTGKNIEAATFDQAIVALEQLKAEGIGNNQVTDVCISDGKNIFGELIVLNDDIKVWWALELMFTANVAVKANGDEELPEKIEKHILSTIKDSKQFQSAADDCQSKQTKITTGSVFGVIGAVGLMAACACLLGR